MAKVYSARAEFRNQQHLLEDLHLVLFNCNFDLLSQCDNVRIPDKPINSNSPNPSLAIGKFTSGHGYIRSSTVWHNFKKGYQISRYQISRYQISIYQISCVRFLTSSQKLGRHASRRVYSVWKSLCRVSFGSKKFGPKRFWKNWKEMENFKIFSS